MCGRDSEVDRVLENCPVGGADGSGQDHLRMGTKPGSGVQVQQVDQGTHYGGDSRQTGDIP